MNKIEAILDHWQGNLDAAHTSALFIRVLNLIGFGLILWMIPIAGEVWGTEHFVIVQQNFDGLGRYAMLLREPFFREHYLWFIVPFLMLCASAVLGFSNFWTRLLTWLLFVNIHYANFEISNGGWHLLHHLFFLAIFLIHVPDGSQGRKASFFRLLHNVGFHFIWIQIAILYGVAGFHKLLGHYWLSGEALMLTLSIEEFSSPWIIDHVQSNTWYLMLLTWISLAYQITFPFLIWWKKVRPALLSVGLIFHLSIAFIVGVADFGLILVGVYSIFIPDKVAERVMYYLRAPRFLSKIAGNRIISGTGD